MMIPTIGEVEQIDLNGLAARLERFTAALRGRQQAKAELDEAEARLAETAARAGKAIDRLRSDEVRGTLAEVVSAAQAVDAANGEREADYSARLAAVRAQKRGGLSLVAQERISAEVPTPFAEGVDKAVIAKFERAVAPALREAADLPEYWLAVDRARKTLAEAELDAVHAENARYLSQVRGDVSAFMKNCDALNAYAKDALSRERAAIAEAEAALAGRKAALGMTSKTK